jgi:DNA-binding transcriptional LysR family regulator
MELRQLRYFLAVADELHFGRAAEKLHMSQPPLTVQIRRLEKELGAALFDRSTRKVSLTPVGEAFQKRVRAVLVDLDDAVAEVHDVGSGRRGRLRVGFVSSASYTVIPEAVRRFRELQPRVDLVLRPLTSGEQVEGLLEGELDLGLIRDPEPAPGLALDSLLTEDLVAVLPERHHLASQRSVSPDDLAGEGMILFPYRLMPGFVSQVLRIFKPGRIPHVVQQAIHQETVVGLVAAGLGISILPESISRVQTAGVALRPISTRPQTSLLIARGGLTAPAGSEFVACLRESVRSTGPAGGIAFRNQE